MDGGHLAPPRRRPVSARINDATTMRPDPSAAALSVAAQDTHMLSLAVALAGALDEAQIPYCHFKSNEALDRSMRGEADLDLLIGAEGAQSFSQILLRLGFKEARLAAAREVPGATVRFSPRAAVPQQTPRTFPLRSMQRSCGHRLQRPGQLWSACKRLDFITRPRC